MECCDAGWQNKYQSRIGNLQNSESVPPLPAGRSSQRWPPAHFWPPTRSSCTSNSSASDLWFSSCRWVAKVGICKRGSGERGQLGQPAGRRD